MGLVFESIARHQGIVSLVLLLAVAACLAFTFSTYLRLKKYERKWRLLWVGSRGSSVEDLLHQHLEERMGVRSDLHNLEERVSTLESLIRSSKRFLGLVRFDAFPDVAGSQSFALAVFDEDGDGAILSSIVGRNSCRVFCKPIVAGRSERDLSQEEQRAVKSAREGGVRTILSP